MIPARIRLAGAPAGLDLALGHTARISLAWWDPTEPEGRREPVLVAGPRAARTVIVVWPTDAQGNVDPDRARRGEVRIVPWDLDEVQLERLRVLASSWPLDQHDLWSRGDWLAPCPETLRTADLGLELESRIEAVIAHLG